MEVSGVPLEVERRFSDPVRLESGWESFLKGENRRGETMPHDSQERYASADSLSDPGWASTVADGIQGGSVNPNGSFSPRPKYALSVSGEAFTGYVPVISAALVDVTFV